MAEIKLDDGHSYEKDDKDNVISITTAVEDPTKKKAEEKRKESENVKSPKANPYSKAATESLISGKPSKMVRGTDFVIDMVPTALGFIMSRPVKNSKASKDAKIRESFDNTDFSHVGGPEILVDANYGSAAAPKGMLKRIINKTYGRVYREKINKELSSRLSKVAKKYDLDSEKAITIFNEVRHNPELFTKGFSNLTDDMLNVSNEMTRYINKMHIPTSKEVVNGSIELVSTNNPKKPYQQKMKKVGTDEIVKKAPTVMNTLATMNAVSDAGNTLFKMKDDHEERFKKLKEGEKGLGATSIFPTITNILDEASNGTWRFNKKMVISETNKIFDYIQKNGTEDQLKKAYEIYADTDFSKKEEAVDALKDMMKLIK